MIPYSEALALLHKAASTRAVESVSTPLVSSVGCVVREAVSAREAVPPFDNSAMDGFAVSSEAARMASADRPVRLSVQGLIAAGDRERPRIDAGTGAVEIMTGAPFPSGAFDAVEKLENVKVHRRADGVAEWVELSRPLEPGENLRRRGEDFEVGQQALLPGLRMRPEQIMALASVGVAHVHVARRPRVVLIATGKELVDASERDLPPGAIRNSTTPYLLAALPLLGADVRFMGVIADDPRHFTDVLAGAAQQRPDVVLVTGAASVGKYDFVRASLESAGATVAFNGVAIRPGKPVLFATLREAGVAFGMPGNPIATAVALRFFVEPYLRAICGESAEPALKARLKGMLKKPAGLRCFFKATVGAGPQGLRVEVLPGQASFMVSPLLVANGWVALPEACDSLPDGATVDVYPLFPSPPGWAPLAEEGE